MSVNLAVTGVRVARHRLTIEPVQITDEPGLKPSTRTQ